VHYSVTASSASIKRLKSDHVSNAVLRQGCLLMYLRLTTREYLVTRGNFRSRDKDGDAHPSIRHSRNLTAWLYVLYEPDVSYIAGIGIFDRFAPVTLTLTRWPYHIRTWTRIRWRCIGYANIIWTLLCQKAFESYRLTDRQTRPKLYATPLRGWSKSVFLKNSRAGCSTNAHSNCRTICGPVSFWQNKRSRDFLWGALFPQKVDDFF